MKNTSNKHMLIYYIIMAFIYLFLALGETLLKGSHRFIFIISMISGVCLYFVMIYSLNYWEEIIL